MRAPQIFTKGWLFFILLCQIIGIIYSVVAASAKGGMDLHSLIYYLMFYLSFTNTITVIASVLFVIFEKSLKHRFQSSPVIAAVGIVIIGISIYVSNTIVPKIVHAICSPTVPHDVDQSHVLFVASNIFLSALILASYTIIFIYRKLHWDWEKKIYEIESLKRLHTEAKYAALQSKVNPHFLFNTLNTILDLVPKSPKKVESIILSLSDIYRRMLGLPDDSLISIREEVDLVRQYLDVEKVRLNERLTYHIAVDDNLFGIEIPPLVIQTLVENAIKHGIAPKKEGGWIEITITQDNGRVCICVDDNGIGIKSTPRETGFGLTGTRKRLDLCYNGKATLQIDDRKEGGTTVRIIIPHEDKNHTR